MNLEVRKKIMLSLLYFYPLFMFCISEYRCYFCPLYIRHCKNKDNEYIHNKVSHGCNKIFRSEIKIFMQPLHNI